MQYFPGAPREVMAIIYDYKHEMDQAQQRCHRAYFVFKEQYECIILFTAPKRLQEQREMWREEFMDVLDHWSDEDAWDVTDIYEQWGEIRLQYRAIEWLFNHSLELEDLAKRNLWGVYNMLLPQLSQRTIRWGDSKAILISEMRQFIAFMT